MTRGRARQRPKVSQEGMAKARSQAPLAVRLVQRLDDAGQRWQNVLALLLESGRKAEKEVER